jgi:hypothetical protein
MTKAPTLILLGPQRPRWDVGRALAELGARRAALVTAGWQEREKDDAALVDAAGVPSVNLRLHARSQEVFDGDPELTQAYQARQELLRHLQGFYRVRLEKTDDAARAISVRHVEPELLEQEWKVSVDQFRQLDPITSSAAARSIARFARGGSPRSARSWRATARSWPS